MLNRRTNMTIYLTHTIVFVSNMQRALDFYCNILGLTAATTSPGWSVLDAGPGPKLALHLTPEPPSAPAPGPTLPPGQVQLTFSVAAIDVLCADLRSRGFTVTGPADQPEIGLRTAYVRDPDGTALQLTQPLSPG
jgi:catechol 2,3-dioxygenase-like lactoylglutathione lyase family enzyme